MARSKALHGSQGGLHSRGPTGWDLKMGYSGGIDSKSQWLFAAIVLLILIAPPAVIFRETLIRTFGIAMGPAALMLAVSSLVAIRHPSSLIYKFNWWLAVVTAGAIVFGIMAFFEFEYAGIRNLTMGGAVGDAIIGDTDRWGLARLSAMGLLVFILVAPIVSYQAALMAVFSISWVSVFLYRLAGALVEKIRGWNDSREVRSMVSSLNRMRPPHMSPSEMLPRLAMVPPRPQPREESPDLVQSPDPNEAEDFNYEAAVMGSVVDSGPAPGSVGTGVLDPEDEEGIYTEDEENLDPEDGEDIYAEDEEDLDPEDEGDSEPPVVSEPSVGIEAPKPAQTSMFAGPDLSAPQPTNGASPEDIEDTGPALPPLDLLDAADEVDAAPTDHQERAEQIESALASHGIDAKVAQINSGPTVTQFGVEPGWFRKYKETRERDAEGKLMVDEQGNPVTRRDEVSKKRVRVDQIAALDKDLALAMAAPTIRIEAPIPGKALVGIEVPNVVMGKVGLREALASPEFQKTLGKSKLAVALGKGSAGQMVMGDLASMPHLLIAGSTGSGKSVCITSLIASLLMNNGPRDVQFVMVDPKRVELVPFSTLPHLTTPVIMDMEKVVGALKWVTEEMDRRYKVMAGAGARNISGYNSKVSEEERMTYLVVVVDELADLMMVAPFDVEQSLARLAQMGRATGIHLIVATQRPSVNVITGLIKANFPTRISFAVTSMTDSRVILDVPGAEKLLGRGDMLYLPSDASKPKRLQGVFLSDTEVERIVHFWSQKAGGAPELPSIEELLGDDPTDDAPAPEDSLSVSPLWSGPSETLQEIQEDEDPLFAKARNLARRHKSVSASLLQRRLGIGYPKAASLLDQLEENGIVSAGEPGKSRVVLTLGEEDDDYQE